MTRVVLWPRCQHPIQRNETRRDEPSRACSSTEKRVDGILRAREIPEGSNGVHRFESRGSLSLEDATTRGANLSSKTLTFFRPIIYLPSSRVKCELIKSKKRKKEIRQISQLDLVQLKKKMSKVFVKNCSVRVGNKISRKCANMYPVSPR